MWGRGQPSSPDGRHAGSVAAEKAGHSPCPQLGIARALRLPLRQTSQALLLACNSTGRKMNNIWSKRKAKINAWIIIVISMEYGTTSTGLFKNDEKINTILAINFRYCKASLEADLT